MFELTSHPSQPKIRLYYQVRTKSAGLHTVVR